MLFLDMRSDVVMGAFVLGYIEHENLHQKTPKLRRQVKMLIKQTNCESEAEFICREDTLTQTNFDIETDLLRQTRLFY